jgi:peptide/nickel transport system permease protein
VLFFTIRRLISSVFVLLASSILVFILASSTADPTAPFRTRQPPPPPEFFANFRHQLGLDEPLHIRYWHWLTGVLHGDFGKNVDNNPVAPDLFHRVGVTARMVVGAMILAVILAIVVGVITAVRQYKLSDYAFTVVSYMLIALPVFWFAALLKEFVAIKINGLIGGDEPFLFTLGEESPGLSTYGTSSQLFWDHLRHLILPTISLAALNFASWGRYQRSSMLDVLGSDFMRLARAKGLPWRRVLVRHGLRNALIPLTTVVALQVGGILGGAILTERVFVWHGMGEYLTQNALGKQDVNVLLGWLIVAAFFVIVFNLIADLLYAVLDPRIRLS